MDKKEQILHYHRIDGLSQREIAAQPTNPVGKGGRLLTQDCS